jgi:hypothetical protein
MEIIVSGRHRRLFPATSSCQVNIEVAVYPRLLTVDIISSRQYIVVPCCDSVLHQLPFVVVAVLNHAASGPNILTKLEMYLMAMQQPREKVPGTCPQDLRLLQEHIQLRRAHSSAAVQKVPV